MAGNNNAVQRHELEELRARMDWVDEERRKSARTVAQLQQQVEQQERAIKSRDQRIKDLEERLANAMSQINRASQVDAKLQQFKDELVALIEQYDARRIRAAEEADRLRRVEQEMAAREIGEIKKELPEIGRLRTDMELRQAEESRLANLIGKLQTRMPPLENRVETWERDISFINDKVRQLGEDLTKLESLVPDLTKRFEPLENRLDILNNSMLKAEANIQDLTGLQFEVRQSMKTWMDQIQLGEYERNQRLENWKSLMQEHQERIEQFAKEWVAYSGQYKEAQMALEALSEWQRQFEQQQRETAEMSRVEISRMQTRWDNFLAENEKRWRNFQTEHEQRTADGARRDKQLEEQLYELQELFNQMQSDKDTLWRVQAAQLDAIKQIPRIWLEEVEKARARDPNRRRQPALVPVDNEL